MAQWKKAENVV